MIGECYCRGNNILRDLEEIEALCLGKNGKELSMALLLSKRWSSGKETRLAWLGGVRSC